MLHPDNEAEYTCDHCGESIVIPIDLTQGRDQEYVEDCPVCCSPNVIRVHVDADGQIDLDSQSEQDRY